MFSSRELKVIKKVFESLSNKTNSTEVQDIHKKLQNTNIDEYEPDKQYFYDRMDKLTHLYWEAGIIKNRRNLSALDVEKLKLIIDVSLNLFIENHKLYKLYEEHKFKSQGEFFEYMVQTYEKNITFQKDRLKLLLSN